MTRPAGGSKSMFYFSLTGKNTEVVMVGKTVHDDDRKRI